MLTVKSILTGALVFGAASVPAGVVVTDPINADAAGWLKAEIAKLTNQPITHLIYSHTILTFLARFLLYHKEGVRNSTKTTKNAKGHYDHPKAGRTTFHCFTHRSFP